MKVAYASQTGNVAQFVENLELESLEIMFGDEEIEEEYIIVTYTDGLGDVPEVVEEFLENNSEKLRGVVASGNMAWADTYCLAADVIADEYGVPILAKIEDEGTQEDVQNILEKIKEL